MTAKYRGDIDGLRTLAILPITFFHAGIPGFSGGFVGVDIFFVISGYLITRGVLAQIEAGRFSIADFYERRLRRIVPALFVMVAVTMAAGNYILLPSEIPEFYRSVAGTILFASNIVFFRDAGYFDSASVEKPLLHTWSLEVEEQFYIFAPVLLVLLVRFAPQRYRWPLAALAAASFALCVVLTPTHPAGSFYLLPTRAWELMAGMLVAAGAAPRLPAPLREALALTGALMIALSIAMLDSRVPFPGSAAALPVTGAALVIAYGERTVTGALLATRPMVSIGLISYSLYLWHWPLIVFARDLGWLGPDLGSAIAVVALSIVLAALSYRLVETPFRNRSRVGPRSIVAFAATGSLAILAVSAVALRSDGWPARFPPTALAYDGDRFDFSPSRGRCHVTADVSPDPAQSCVFGGEDADTVVWADSHGVELSLALAEFAHRIQSITVSACPPALGFHAPERASCEAHNRAVLDYLKRSPQIRTVVLTAYFSHYLAEDHFEQHLGQTVQALLGLGKGVVVVGPVPAEGESDLPKLLARQGDLHKPLEVYRKEQSRVIALLGDLQQRGARVVWPSDYLCSDDGCRMTADGHSVLFDSHHLSMTGARYLGRRIIDLIWRSNSMICRACPPRSLDV